MQRRAFAFLVLGLAVSSGRMHAQPRTATARLGFLWTSTPEPQYLEAFRAGLRDLAYVEGRNIVLEHRSAANVVSRLDGLAREFVTQRVDIVVTQGTPAARAMSAATKTIPIVVALGEPLGARLAARLSQPGGNVTGLTVLSAELNGKRLELLKEINPKISRIAMLFDPTTTDVDGVPLAGPRGAEAAARSLQLQVQSLPVKGPDDFANAFAAAGEARAEAMLLTPSPVLSFHNKLLIELAARHRLPAIYGNPEAVKLGGLMSYGPSYTALFRRAATYVDKILKGANPADLPIEQPTNFELAINVKTAKALGITIPSSLLVRADEVIK